jgi:hypothetical protein
LLAIIGVLFDVCEDPPVLRDPVFCNRPFMNTLILPVVLLGVLVRGKPAEFLAPWRLILTGTPPIRCLGLTMSEFSVSAGFSL